MVIIESTTNLNLSETLMEVNEMLTVYSFSVLFAPLLNFILEPDWLIWQLSHLYWASLFLLITLLHLLSTHSNLLKQRDISKA